MTRRFRVPCGVSALALVACLLAGCGRDETASSTPGGGAASDKIMRPVRETFRSAAEFMNDPSFRETVKSGRATVEAATAFRDRLAAQARAYYAGVEARLGTNATEAAVHAALEGDVEWKNLKTKLADAETAVREARAKLLAATREGMVGKEISK